MPRTHFALYGFTPACKRAFRPGNYSTPIALRAAEFKAAPADEVCHYCAAAFLKLRNAQRKQKGLPPVATYNAPAK